MPQKLNNSNSNTANVSISEDKMDVEEKIEVRRSKRPAETETCRSKGPVEESQSRREEAPAAHTRPFIKRRNQIPVVPSTAR
jgi:hypothetical protein